MSIRSEIIAMYQGDLAHRPDLITLAEGLWDLEIPVTATPAGIKVAACEAFRITQMAIFRDTLRVPDVQLTVRFGIVCYGDFPIESVPALLHRLTTS